MQQKNPSHPPARTDEARDPSASPVVCEALESRQMMSSAPWGGYANFIEQNTAVKQFSSYTGSGQTVAVIDTGISTANNSSLSGKVVAGWNFIDNNANWQDTDGHGTAVATLLAGRKFTYAGNRFQGIAPGARLVALKVDDGVNDPTPTNIRAALQWVIDHKSKYNITAVNISEGDGSYGSKITGPDYGDLLAQLRSMNVFVAAAAGNESTRSAVDYPAADVNVVAVGSTDLSDNLSSFTNAGPDLDLLAPGEGIVTRGLNGAFLTAAEGTSFSTPLVVGAAVLLHQANKFLTPAQILNDLQNTPFYDTDPIGGGTYARLDLFNSLTVARQQFKAAKRK
jgi:subtilisin family serine protease